VKVRNPFTAARLSHKLQHSDRNMVHKNKNQRFEVGTWILNLVLK